MKVALYNRSLPTLGGGERYSLSLAEHLSRTHQVTFISHEAVTADAVRERLALDVSPVTFLVFPSCAARDLERMTARFDVFINASYQRFFPARAGLNILLVYFPSPPTPGLLPAAKQGTARLLKRIFMVPTLNNCSATLTNGGGHVTVKTLPALSLDLPGAGNDYSFSFQIASGHPALHRVTAYLNDRSLREIDLAPNGAFTTCEITVPRKTPPGPSVLVLASEAGSPEPAGHPSALVLKDPHIRHPGQALFRRLPERLFPGWKNRLFHRPLQQPPVRDCLNTYQTIWTISEYSRRWVEKYWQRPSEIIHPPVEVHQFQPGEKGPKILSVGRFFPGLHNKKHAVLIAAFRKMVDQGLSGWELHLVGGTREEKPHQRYLKKLKAQARGYPIFIHTDLPHADLVALYSESSIYWHACGYGENPRRHPDKFEHFGITTVEGLASGCVPVVFGRGGQGEIVDHGHNGFLWYDLRELLRYTWLIIRDPSLRLRLADQALRDSRRFDSSRFRARLSELGAAVGL